MRIPFTYELYTFFFFFLSHSSVFVFCGKSFLYKKSKPNVKPHDSEFPDLLTHVRMKTVHFDLLLIEYFNSLNKTHFNFLITLKFTILALSLI